MSNKETGGPAFPVVCDGDPCLILHAEGMTLRDYFAGQAIAGIIGNIRGVDVKSGQTESEARAVLAYRQADFLIKEKNK